MSRSRPKFPWSTPGTYGTPGTPGTYGTPGTMTPLLARKSVAFSDLGFPYTEARVIRNLSVFFIEFHQQARLEVITDEIKKKKKKKLAFTYCTTIALKGRAIKFCVTIE